MPVQPHRQQLAEAILEEVSRTTGISTTLLIGRRRGPRHVSDARQIAMAIMCQLTSMSLDEVAKACGRSTHATAMHARDAVRSHCETNEAFRNRFRLALHRSVLRAEELEPLEATEAELRTDPGRLLTTSQACDYLQVSPSTLLRLRRKGELPAVRIGGSIRFRLGEMRRITALL